MWHLELPWAKRLKKKKKKNSSKHVCQLKSWVCYYKSNCSRWQISSQPKHWQLSQHWAVFTQDVTLLPSFSCKNTASKNKNTKHNTYPEVKIIKQGVTLSSFKNLVAAVVSAIRDGAWKYLHNCCQTKASLEKKTNFTHCTFMWKTSTNTMRVTWVGNGWQHYFTLKQQQKGVGEVQNEKIRAFLHWRKSNLLILRISWGQPGISVKVNYNLNFRS